MIKPIEIMTTAGITMAIVIGKEYLDGASFKYEKLKLNLTGIKKYFHSGDFPGRNERVFLLIYKISSCISPAS